VGAGVEQVGGLVADLYWAGYPRADQLHPVLCNGPPKPKFKQIINNNETLTPTVTKSNLYQWPVRQ
jgi:hypothetical protein